jgi:hypothetical protein
MRNKRVIWLPDSKRDRAVYFLMGYKTNGGQNIVHIKLFLLWVLKENV